MSITENNNVPNVSLSTAASKKATIPSIKKNCIVPFLLGVISCKASLNHKYHSIVIHAPLNKIKLLERIKEMFGGFIYHKYNNQTVSNYNCYIIRAKKDLRKVREAVQIYRPKLPPESIDNLDEFLNVVLKRRNRNLV
jgi:hypothetical protein